MRQRTAPRYPRGRLAVQRPGKDPGHRDTGDTAQKTAIFWRFGVSLKFSASQDTGHRNSDAKIATRCENRNYVFNIKTLARKKLFLKMETALIRADIPRQR